MKIVNEDGSIREIKMINGNDATIIQNKSGYTIWSNKSGGAIVTAENLKEAIADFTNGMKLSNALRKFMHWKRIID